jgi:hypothetical protein
MHKLMVVAGPNRGSSFALKDGETTVGRQQGNVIHLDSARVSKHHCKFVVEGNVIRILDGGSANGTYVNGKLTREQSLALGDRVAVGEYVLEVVSGESRALAPSWNVVDFPQASRHSHLGPQQTQSTMESIDARSAEPDTLLGKAEKAFDQVVLPFFVEMNFRQEWRMILVLLVSVFLIGNLVVSVQPLLDGARQTTIREVSRRAQTIARQVVERNSGALATQAETRTDLGGLEREEGVRLVLLTDLDSRVLAPSSKYQQMLTTGPEARLAARARDAFKRGRETGIVGEIDTDLVGAVEPVKIFNPQQGRNLIVGMAVVSIDTSISTLDLGEIGVIYSQTLLYTAILGFLLFWIFYRLTLKPFQILNEDIDKVLKGELTQVTHEFKIQELDSLWDVINSALQRVQKDQGVGSGNTLTAPVTDEALGAYRMMSGLSRHGMLWIDAERKVIEMNSIFEEVSGIRAEQSQGQLLTHVARDQAFSVLMTDLFDRAQPGGGDVTEEFEFSGIAYRVHATALGTPATGVQGFLVVAERKED